MLLSAAIWIQATDFFTYIRLQSYVYAAILALHLAAMSLFGGMNVATDLRLLGWALRDRPVSDVVNQLRWPKRIGFLFALTCGFLLFGSKAEEYYYNTFFRAKVTLLILVAVHALIFRPASITAPRISTQPPSCPRERSSPPVYRSLCGPAS